jgi:hypothetical protein
MLTTMFRGLRGFFGAEVLARDGQIGRVADFYCDDEFWIIRYLSAEGEPLGDRKALLSMSVIEADWDRGEFRAGLSREAIRRSPSVDTERRIMRRHEEELNNYYTWMPYWGTASAGPDGRGKAAGRETRSHLVSVADLTLCVVRANDGFVGRIEDFIFNDADHSVRYFVVGMPARPALVSPWWIDRIDWSAGTVHVNLDRPAIAQSPPFDLDVPLSRDYETELYNHYGRPPYWS